MLTKIEKTIDNKSQIRLVDNLKTLEKTGLSKDESKYVRQQYQTHQITFFEFNRAKYVDFIVVLESSTKNIATDLEKARVSGKNTQSRLNKLKIDDILLLDDCSNSALYLAFAEGLCLSDYHYTQHQTKTKKTKLKIQIFSKKITKSDVEQLNLICDAVYFCKDLVNEPHNFQSAVQFAKTLANKAKQVGVKATIFDQKQIETLKMGGLLGVNQGSKNPPAFIVLEWKPKSSKTAQSIVLIGKGLVFDTGGSNLKTGEYMNEMKSDMAGGATVAATVFALAAMQFKHPVVALIPATDNRLSAEALVPGDVITMRSGKTVEVINTDAEGRLILADALDYAKLYKPKLVIDAATLTGAASRAIGKHGIVAMQNKAEKFLQLLQKSGEEVHERIVEFPLWDEYAEELKSDVADLKNCGSGYGGAITAGKFLTEFTDYPFIHLDIAGVAYNSKPYKYYGNQASGFGVRLLINFFKFYDQF